MFYTLKMMFSRRLIFSKKAKASTPNNPLLKHKITLLIIVQIKYKVLLANGIWELVERLMY